MVIIEVGHVFNNRYRFVVAGFQQNISFVTATMMNGWQICLLLKDEDHKANTIKCIYRQRPHLLTFYAMHWPHI